MHFGSPEYFYEVPPENTNVKNTFIVLYCFLPVQYLNYVFIFQLIALNCYFL